jgi:predicted enzyme related to lactoylglutathione lyase
MVKKLGVDKLEYFGRIRTDIRYFQKGVVAMSQFKDVNVVYVYVKAWDAAKRFYRETLEWPIIWTDDGIGWEEYGVEGATHVAINRWAEGEPPVGGGATCTFTVDSCSATRKALQAKGVRCDEVVSIPGVVTFGTFYDPEGNRFQFAGGA